MRTNWWKSFVDGTNPEDRGRALVARFFRMNNVDPYLLEHAMINDYKRWLLLEIQDPLEGKKGKDGPKAVELGMKRLAHLKRFQLSDLQRMFPIEQKK